MLVNLASYQLLTDAGWIHIQSTRDWYFYSSISRTTYLHMVCDASTGSVTIESITLNVNGQMVGKVYDSSIGIANWGMLESKSLGSIISIDFRRAVKPLR